MNTDRSMPGTVATTWVEVSSGALERNYQSVAAAAQTMVCAVVKANAYGHGLVETARIFERAGARWLAVTRTEEARALRAAGFAARILLLTPPPSAATLAEAIGLGCSLCLSSADDIERYATAARLAGKPATVHLKVDTGMGRLGVPAADAPDAAARVVAEDSVVLEGVYTHFADAAGPSGRAQLSRFNDVRAALGKHASRAIVHASNSAGLLALPDARFDMVRIGTLLYGQNPPGADAPFALEETFTWFATVVAVRTLAAGDTVGYASEYKARKPERIATLAVGWADGYTVEPHARTPSLSDAMKTTAKTLARPDSRTVTFASGDAPVTGRVGMQAVSVSLADHPDVKVGDVARIPARRLLVSPAIERVYVP